MTNDLHLKNLCGPIFIDVFPATFSNSYKNLLKNLPYIYKGAMTVWEEGGIELIYALLGCCELLRD